MTSNEPRGFAPPLSDIPSIFEFLGVLIVFLCPGAVVKFEGEVVNRVGLGAGKLEWTIQLAD